MLLLYTIPTLYILDTICISAFCFTLYYSYAEFYFSINNLFTQNKIYFYMKNEKISNSYFWIYIYISKSRSANSFVQIMSLLTSSFYCAIHSRTDESYKTEIHDCQR